MEDPQGAFLCTDSEIVSRLAQIEYFFGDFWLQLSIQTITQCLKTKLLTKICRNGEIKAIFNIYKLEVSNPALQAWKHSAASSFLSSLSFSTIYLLSLSFFFHTFKILGLSSDPPWTSADCCCHRKAKKGDDSSALETANFGAGWPDCKFHLQISKICKNLISVVRILEQPNLQTKSCKNL